MPSAVLKGRIILYSDERKGSGYSRACLSSSPWYKVKISSRMETVVREGTKCHWQAVCARYDKHLCCVGLDTAR